MTYSLQLRVPVNAFVIAAILALEKEKVVSHQCLHKLLLAVKCYLETPDGLQDVTVLESSWIGLHLPFMTIQSLPKVGQGNSPPEKYIQCLEILQEAMQSCIEA